MSYSIEYTSRTIKEIVEAKRRDTYEKIKGIITIIANDPFYIPPPLEKLRGDLKGYYSRRINIKDRIVYSIDISNKVILIESILNHY